jgi:hypothetical protein
MEGGMSAFDFLPEQPHKDIGNDGYYHAQYQKYQYGKMNGEVAFLDYYITRELTHESRFS